MLLLVFAVLAGAFAVIGAALAAPVIDPKHCMQQGAPSEACQGVAPQDAVASKEAIAEEEEEE